MDHDDHQMRVRLPLDVMQALREATKESGRSLNAEILMRLRRSFKGSPDTEGLETRIKEMEAEMTRVRKEIGRLIGDG